MPVRQLVSSVTSETPVADDDDHCQERTAVTTPGVQPFTATDAIRRAAIVALTLGTASIHAALGGPLFILNAIGYVAGATAMIAPSAIAIRFRWLIRIGLASYAATTIVAWAFQGPFFTTAYIAKVIELTLIALLSIDFVRFDGNPINVIRRAKRGTLTIG